jgi:hypothetical protein
MAAIPTYLTAYLPYSLLFHMRLLGLLLLKRNINICFTPHHGLDGWYGRVFLAFE